MTAASATTAASPWLPATVALLVGVAVHLAGGRPRPVRPAADRGPAAALHVDPALLLDLVAAVVTAGAAPAAAVTSVVQVLADAGWPRAALLGRAVSGPSAHGPGSGRAGPGHASLGSADLDDAVAALRRGLWIAEQTGAPVAALLSSAAAELRRRRRRAAALAAARLGVRVVAPLGLCTLPAFGLLAVAPVLLSLGRDLLG